MRRCIHFPSPKWEFNGPYLTEGSIGQHTERIKRQGEIERYSTVQYSIALLGI